MSESFIILLALGVSIALAALTVGLRTSADDALYLLRSPGLLVRSFLVMNVLMPLLALWAAIAFGLDPAVKVVLIVLSMSPLPPFSTVDGTSNDDGSYAAGLLGASSLLASFVVPASVLILGRVFGVAFGLSTSVITRLVIG